MFQRMSSAFLVALGSLLTPLVVAAATFKVAFKQLKILNSTCARIQVSSLPNASTKGTSSIPVQRSLSIPSIIILKSSTMMMINMQHDERDPTNYVDWDP